MKQGLFYIPETKEEIKILLDEIIERNVKNSEVPKMDFIYSLMLMQAFYTEEEETERKGGVKTPFLWEYIILVNVCKCQ